MTDAWTVLGSITIGATALYLTLFVAAARPVSVRFWRLAVAVLTVSALRAVLVIVGFAWQPVGDPSLAAVAVLLLAGRRHLARLWLVRIAADDFGRQIETACRGLLLACDGPSAGRFVFTVGEVTAELRLYNMGKRLQFIVLPPIGLHGKVTLLNGWLAKQFPGPIPRIKIVLKKGVV